MIDFTKYDDYHALDTCDITDCSGIYDCFTNWDAVEGSFYISWTCSECQDRHDRVVQLEDGECNVPEEQKAIWRYQAETNRNNQKII